jgi:hypothetical protein
VTSTRPVALRHPLDRAVELDVDSFGDRARQPPLPAWQRVDARGEDVGDPREQLDLADLLSLSAISIVRTIVSHTGVELGAERPRRVGPRPLGVQRGRPAHVGLVELTPGAREPHVQREPGGAQLRPRGEQARRKP